jgi:GYF domain 2
MKYFLQREGRSFGPYSFDDLKRYQSEGRIGPDDKIRAEDSEQWVAQTEFFNPPAPTPPAAPVPVFMPPPAPVFMPPSAAPTPAPNPFASPTDANPVWNPFAAPGAAANPFGAPPAQGGFGAPPAQGGFGAPPAQGFGGPPAGGGFAPNPAASGAWPTPPEMQWWLVLLIGVFCGFFVLYWFYTQLVFVKKIDPQSKAMKMILGGWGLLFGGMIVAAILGAAVNSSLAIIPILVGMVCYLGGIILAILGIFDMRTSIERHYNTVENIGLKLSPVMTFFFDIYYFQYHFSRIAEWKKTGRLAA